MWFLLGSAMVFNVLRAAFADVLPIDPADIIYTGKIVDKSAVESRPWKPLRIHVVYDKTSVYSVPEEDQILLMDAVSRVVEFYQSAVRVQRDPEGLRFQLTCDKENGCRRRFCSWHTEAVFPPEEDYFVCSPANASDFGHDVAKCVFNPLQADFVWQIVVDRGKDRRAAAAACYQDINTLRPIGGITMMSAKSLAKMSSRLIRGTADLLYDTLRHEMGHALFFTDYHFTLYPNYKQHYIVTRRSLVYPKPDDVKDPVDASENDFTGISFPLALHEARKYTGCASLKYVEIEMGGGEGTAGSHYEVDLFPYETLVSSAPPDRRYFSAISMALMEDSGWYKVDYSLAEVMPPVLNERNNSCPGAKFCSLRKFRKEEKLKCLPGRRSHYYFLPSMIRKKGTCEYNQVVTCQLGAPKMDNLRCLDHESVVLRRKKSRRTHKWLRNNSIFTAQCFEVICDVEELEVKFVSEGKTYKCDRPGQRIQLSEKFNKEHQWNPLKKEYAKRFHKPIKHIRDYAVDHTVICPDPCQVCESWKRCKPTFVHQLDTNSPKQASFFDLFSDFL